MNMKWWYILVCCLLLCCGCGTKRVITKEVPVEVPRVVHDTVVSRLLRSDTVLIRDSVVMRDTLIERWHTVYKSRTARDTVVRARTDTVTKPVYVTNTVTKTEKKPLAWWQKWLMWFGGVEIVIMIVTVVRRYWF